MEPVGSEGSALRQHRQQRLLSEKHLADDTIPSPETTAAPRARPQLEATQNDRVPGGARGSAPPAVLPAPRPGPPLRLPRLAPALEDLRVGDARVGHVAVHAAAPVPTGARARAARYSLVVAHVGVTQGHVVHAALGGEGGGPRSLAPGVSLLGFPSGHALSSQGHAHPLIHVPVGSRLPHGPRLLVGPHPPPASPGRRRRPRRQPG